MASFQEDISRKPTTESKELPSPPEDYEGDTVSSEADDAVQQEEEVRVSIKFHNKATGDLLDLQYILSDTNSVTAGLRGLPEVAVRTKTFKLLLEAFSATCEVCRYKSSLILTLYGTTWTEDLGLVMLHITAPTRLKCLKVMHYVVAGYIFSGIAPLSMLPDDWARTRALSPLSSGAEHETKFRNAIRGIKDLATKLRTKKKEFKKMDDFDYPRIPLLDKIAGSSEKPVGGLSVYGQYCSLAFEMASALFEHKERELLRATSPGRFKRTSSCMELILGEGESDLLPHIVRLREMETLARVFTDEEFLRWSELSKEKQISKLGAMSQEHQAFVSKLLQGEKVLLSGGEEVWLDKRCGMNPAAAVLG